MHRYEILNEVCTKKEEEEEENVEYWKSPGGNLFKMEGKSCILARVSQHKKFWCDYVIKFFVIT